MTTAERLAAARDAAFGPAEERGLLRFAGKDALAFLHRMSTQDLARLAPGETAYAAFLEHKGHLVSDALVRRGEGEVLALTARESAGDLAAHLGRFVLRDDVKVTDLSAGFRCVAVLGERAGGELRPGPGEIAFRDPRRGAPAVSLAAPAAGAEGLRGRLERSGAAGLSAEDLEALRILAGIPRFGADMDRSRLAIEAGIAGAAISFEKGCYIGQEVVLRGTFRGQVQRGLVQLGLPAGAGPGSRLLAAGQEVGAVTSAAETPEGRLGLGYLRRAHWASGTRLSTDGGEAVVRRALVEERD
jgi:folate-binding protein YgfZ